LTLAAIFVDRVEAGVSIIVNLGEYATAEAAGHDEANVDWLDDDPRDDAICTEAFAAMELQKHLRVLTGREDDFAIVDDGKIPEGELIVVGSPANNAAAERFASKLSVSLKQLEELGPEGYRIKTGEIDGRRATLIAGGGRVGTLYGAYDLLHRMGCRWFSPAEFDADVPSENGDRRLKHQGASPRFQWNPSFDVVERPSFSLRGFHAVEKRETPEFILWMARNRLNFWTVYVHDQALLRKLGIQMSCGGHLLQWLFMHADAPYPYDHRKFVGDEGNPQDPYAIGEDYRGDADGDGRLSYFEAHPEWYPLLDGRRITGVDRLQSRSVNFCTSNPDAMAEFTGNILRSFCEGDYRPFDGNGDDGYGIKKHAQAIGEGIFRGADAINLWMLDVGRWCECEKCKALGTPTDRNLLVVHHFDRAVKRARREGRLARPIRIVFMAYSDVVEPPSRPLPEDFDYESCTAAFFPIGRCYVHNFDDPACDMNSTYRRQLDGWTADPARHYRGKVLIGEYYNVSRFDCLPGCFMHVMAHDIPHYYGLGARQFHYMHATTGRWGTKSLTNYQMARQLWDVETDCEALWADYFTRRYGPASTTMRRFYESLEKMFCNLEALKARRRPRFTYSLDQGIKPLFPSPHLQYSREPGVESKGPTLREMVAHGEDCRKLIDEAMAIVAQRGQSHFRGGTESPGNVVSAAKIGTAPVDRIRARLAEDERVFTYAELTLRYYDQCARAYQLAWAGGKEDARKHYEEARRVAELLRKDTWSIGLTYTYNNQTQNAFDATRAKGALEKLKKLLAAP